MKLTAVCSKCGSDQLLIPGYDDENQMLRCAQCNANAGYKTATDKKPRGAGDIELKKLIDDFNKKLDKTGFR